MNVVEAISDPELLEPSFRGPSWDAWKGSVLKPAFGLPMTEGELAKFREIAGGRDPPRKQVRELWIVSGRRAGKDSIASAIACWFAAGTDYRAMLRPGEAATVMCLAVDRHQARIVSDYARAYFQQVKLLAPLVTGETAHTISLSTGAELSVVTNNFRGLRGRSVACAILDECAYWRSEESANPDAEVYNSITPGMTTIPGSMLIGISTPYRCGGLLYQKWKKHFGKDNDDVLAPRPGWRPSSTGSASRPRARRRSRPRRHELSDVLVNSRYGRWIVLSTDTSSRRASCRCNCGTVQQVTFHALQSGESSGCYYCARPRERAAEASPGHLPDWRPQR